MTIEERVSTMVAIYAEECLLAEAHAAFAMHLRAAVAAELRALADTAEAETDYESNGVAVAAVSVSELRHRADDVEAGRG